MQNRFSGSGHYLLLGHSRFRDVVLAELSETELVDRKQIVLLSPESEDAPKGKSAGKTETLFFAGDPTDGDALERVSAASAKAILVITCGEPDADPTAARIVRALLECTRHIAILPQSQPCPIIVVTETEEWYRKIGSEGGSRVHSVCLETVLARIVAQVSRQKMLSLVYREILTFRGNDLYSYPVADLSGLTFAHSLRAFENACVAGIVRNGSVRLNPAKDTRLEDTDQLILLAPDLRNITKSQPLLPAPNNADMQETTIATKRDESTLFLGWNRLCPRIVVELAQYAGKNSRITILAEEDIALPPEVTNLRGVSATTEHAAISDSGYLAGVPWQYYENIIIPGDASFDDAAALKTHRLVREALSQRGFDNNITTVLFDPRSGETGGDGGMFVSAEIAFRIVARFIINPEMQAVVRQLTTSEGSEIYLMPVENYVKIGTNVTFYTILESARRKNETAIGYISAESKKIVLNPQKAERIRFYHFDRIVVLADEN